MNTEKIGTHLSSLLRMRTTRKFAGHRSSSFSLLIAWKPLGAATTYPRTLKGTVDAGSALSKGLRPLHKDALLGRMASSSLRQTPATCEAYHDEHVRFEPTFVPGDYVIIEQPPRPTTRGERFDVEGYRKLLPRRLGPYRFHYVGMELVKIRQDGIEITVSINRITKAPLQTTTTTMTSPIRNRGLTMILNFPNQGRNARKNTPWKE